MLSLRNSRNVTLQSVLCPLFARHISDTDLPILYFQMLLCSIGSVHILVVRLQLDPELISYRLWPWKSLLCLIRRDFFDGFGYPTVHSCKPQEDLSAMSVSDHYTDIPKPKKRYCTGIRDQKKGLVCWHP